MKMLLFLLLDNFGWKHRIMKMTIKFLNSHPQLAYADSVQFIKLHLVVTIATCRTIMAYGFYILMRIVWMEST